MLLSVITDATLPMITNFQVGGMFTVLLNRYDEDFIH